MSLETGTFISDLVASNPTATDLKSQGDDHIRLVKSAVKATFPNITGAVTATQAQLNSTTATSAAGFISMWPTPVAPSGFLLCNGLTVSRTTYAALFAVVGTIFGAGDGSTTFALPNYQDRMPIGAGSAYAANSLGGSKDAIVASHTHTSTFTGSALAAHSHAVSDPGHAHSLANDRPYGGYGAGATIELRASPPQAGVTGTAVTGITVAAASAGTPAGTVAVDAAGVSATNANLPPYLGIYFIIKA